ncbi:MAG: hypothetical protein WBC92_00800, partial [Terracidiphilus sp.]
RLNSMKIVRLLTEYGWVGVGEGTAEAGIGHVSRSSMAEPLKNGIGFSGAYVKPFAGWPICR